MLQSYVYAQAVMPLYGQQPRWGLILIDGQEAGLFQIARASALWGALHAVILDRGPLWFEGYGSAQHFDAFVRAYSALFPKRLGRSRRFLPEMSADQADTQEDIAALMAAHGWRKAAQQKAYQTMWLDLTTDEETLRKNMRKSWRQSLSKGEKSGLSIAWDEDGASLPYHLKRYELDKLIKSYEGADKRILLPLLRKSAHNGDLLIGSAAVDKKTIAGMIFLCHGSSATYQIGWSDSAGRKFCAHHTLLWQASLRLKARGITDLDLGGWNNESAKSLKTFKSGIGAKDSILAGQFH